MFECIALTVPAKQSALMVVRLATAGVAAQGEMDCETLEDVKTAVYEACYAMAMQKYVPESLSIRFAPGPRFAVTIKGEGGQHETDGRLPDLKLCRAVLSTMIGHVEVEMDEKGIRRIEMHE